MEITLVAFSGYVKSSGVLVFTQRHNLVVISSTLYHADMQKIMQN